MRKEEVIFIILGSEAIAGKESGRDIILVFEQGEDKGF